MIKFLPIVLLLLCTNIFADDTTILNDDGSQYKAPRLAGDSLAIKPIQTKDSKKFPKIKALLRYSAQYRDTSYHSTQSGTTPITNKKQQYSAIGGYLGYETPTYYNLSLGATFYTAQKLGNNPDDRLGLGGLDETGGSANSYAVLGEAYLKYETTEHDMRVGRREMPDYRFVSLSNIRFSPYTHEGATYENSMLNELTLNLGYINSQKGRNSEEFEGMVRSARVKENDIRGNYDSSNFTNGTYSAQNKAMLMSGLQYTQQNLNLEVWDYYVKDFVNTLYFYTDYEKQISKELSLTLAAQYANQQEVGNAVAGNIDSWFYGLKAQLAINNGITLFSAYNEIAYNENSYDGGTIFVRWGTPQMFNSYQVQDSELAGTKSIGVGAQFELGHMGLIPNSVIRFRYAHYSMPDSLQNRDAAQDRSEATFDLRYSFSKNDGFGIFTQMEGLSLQLRVAYNDYKTNYDYAAYMAIHGYDFSEVTDDFIDTRFYLDYLF